MSDEKGMETPMISLAEHPRASSSIRRARAWGGLLAFAVGGYASYESGMSVAASGFRALVAGMVAYLIVWGLAIAVWRAVVRAEARAAIERAARRRAELLGRPIPGGESGSG
jgi:hypothetical protein